MLSSPDFLQRISQSNHLHARGTEWYKENERALLRSLMSIHGPTSNQTFVLGELGEISFPYFDMGDIDSSKLFGLDEIILFAYYYTNRNYFGRTLDLGANIGLHTLVMKKLGFDVVSYEPDIAHCKQIENVMSLNKLGKSGLRKKAISNKKGVMEYIRVLGNTTGSHLLGSKDEVYGQTEIVNVEVDDILDVLNEGEFDFVKMDVEGHEAVLLDRITSGTLKNTDIMLEIGSRKNASKIYETIKKKGVPAYAQKINWGVVRKLEDLPNHHTQGSLFLSMQDAPNWNRG